MRAASLAGLCLVALCAHAEAAQYSVSFKIVAGELAVDRDAFHVAPSIVKFEPAIRVIVRRERHGSTSVTATMTKKYCDDMRYDPSASRS